MQDISPGPASHYKSINKKEALHIFITAISVGFILSFRDWGVEQIDVASGVENMLAAMIVALVVIVLRVIVQKRFAFGSGYLLRYTLHKWGLLLSIFLAFFFYGWIPYVSTGELHIERSKRLRLGTFRYGLNYGDLAKIALSGIVINIAIILVVKPLSLIFGGFLLTKIIEVNAAIAFFSLLPIPGSDGFMVFYHRRWWWVLATTFVAVYFALILFLGIFSFVIATALALIAMVLFRKAES